MEQTKARIAAGTPVWVIKSLAVVVSLDVLLAIVRHWTGYDLTAKFLAVVLMAILVVLPAGTTWGRIKRYDWQSLLPAYMLLLLATTLFGMH
jgi:hypothetical protein